MKRIDFTKIGEILVQDLGIPQKYVNETLKKAIDDKVLFGESANKLKLIDKEKRTRWDYWVQLKQVEQNLLLL